MRKKNKVEGIAIQFILFQGECIVKEGASSQRVFLTLYRHNLNQKASPKRPKENTFTIGRFTPNKTIIDGKYVLGTQKKLNLCWSIPVKNIVLFA